MAEGDKIYLADKATLDAVNTKVGATTDTGGTATAGSIFAKLNAIISSIASHVANWTAARAANLDAAISSRESEASAASRYNELSQKLGTALDELAAINTSVAGNTKRLTAKKLSVSVPSRTTATVININGAGVVYGGYVNASNTNASVTITIDGTAHKVENNSSGAFGRYVWDPTMFSTLSSGAGVIPAEFKNSLVVTVEALSNSLVNFRLDYSVYE